MGALNASELYTLKWLIISCYVGVFFTTVNKERVRGSLGLTSTSLKRQRVAVCPGVATKTVPLFSERGGV